MLRSISLTNFRGFASLELKDLPRVNLIVGRNNSGKTSLLEAILLLCQPTDCIGLPGQFRPQSGSAGQRDSRWLLRDGEAVKGGAIRGSTEDAQLEVEIAPLSGPEPPQMDPKRPRRMIWHDGVKVWIHPKTGRIACRVLSSEQRRPEQLVPLVGQTLRKKNGEETMQQMLNRVDPRIRKIRVDPGQDGNQGSHVNYVVADTRKWEQTAAYYVDTHKAVRSFVKNAGLGFAIPYLHNGQMHDYQPDFLIRLETRVERYLILETKGYDPLEGTKRAAAERWCAAVNSLGGFGTWTYRIIRRPEEARAVISACCGV